VNNNQEIPKGFWREEASDQYILFVHGWRQQPWERRRFAESAMKRLYWQGYKGRFGLFSWPTDWLYLSTFDDLNLLRLAVDPQNYDRSESIARRSSAFLFGLMHTLNSTYKSFNTFAHSMGNVVVSEALKIQVTAGGDSLVDNYVASQAATVASSYDAIQTREAIDEDSIFPDRQLRKNRVTVVNTGGGPLGGSVSPVDPVTAILKIPEPDKYTYSTPEVGRPQNPYSFETFDEYLKQNKMNVSYYGGIRKRGAANNIVSFGNFRDPALDVWVSNQELKPNLGYSYKPTKVGTPVITNNVLVEGGIEINDKFCEGLIGCTELLYSNLDQRAEIMSRIIEARSFALGSTRGVNGEVAREVNLNSSFGYSNGPFDHSAQFLGNNMERKGYWKQLFEVFDL